MASCPATPAAPTCYGAIAGRARYQGRTLGLTRPFLAETANVVIATMGDAYPELQRRRNFILETLTAEEERFGRTIAGGLILLDEALSVIQQGGELPGTTAFTLYDTHGFPLDLTQKIVAERGISVDEAAYDHAMAEQALSRAATQFKRGRKRRSRSSQSYRLRNSPAIPVSTTAARVLRLPWQVVTR